MIRLDYYRLLPDTQYIGVVDEPDIDCHFSPYSIFVLETRLYPLIYKLFPKIPIDILVLTRYESDKNRMQAYLNIKKLENTTDAGIENAFVDLTDLQREIILSKINEINSYEPNYALIDVEELYKSMPIINNMCIPFSYFATMLQYTGIDSSYNPFIRPEGIYCTFNPNSEYKKAYNEVCKFLVSRISEFYSRGAIVFSNLNSTNSKDELIKNWHLVPIDDEEDTLQQQKEEMVKTIFEPLWTDERFAKNKVDFLTLKLQGDPYISLKVPDNFVKRHGIASMLQKYKYSFVFEGSYLKAEAKILHEAYSIASLVEYGMNMKTGSRKVMVLAASRLSEVYLYFEYANKKFGKNNNSMTYMVSNNENPYIFSCLLPNSEMTKQTSSSFVDLDDLRLSFRDYAVSRLTEVSKVSKFKNMSPHSIIEQEYS
jgi:hypothetical protein